jgi:iron complex transport system ATP-binding protein
VLTPANLRVVYGVEAVVTEAPWGIQVTPVAPTATIEEKEKREELAALARA